MRIAVLAATMVLVCATAAFAQAEACVNPSTRQVDAQATQTWQEMSQRSDPEIMKLMAGTWYFEAANPYNSQVDYQYQRYTADGFFDYRDRVCDTATGACNDYAGQGNYAAIAIGDGSIQFMTVVSDLNRDRQCTGFVARFVDANTLQFSNGVQMKRVQ